MSVDEIMKAVAALPPEELHRFHDLFEDHLAELWERRLAAMAERRVRVGGYHSPVEPCRDLDLTANRR